MKRIIGIATAVLIVTVVVGAPVAAAPADAGLQWDSTLTYRVDTEAGVLNLVSDITLTNLEPNGRDGNTVIRYYFDRFGIYVPDEAEDLTITIGGAALRYEITEPEGEDADGWQLLEIRLNRRLFYRRSADVRIEYNIRGDDPRSDSVFRINPAYASFGVAAWGDPGRVEVEVIIDDAFDVTATGSSYDIELDGSDVIYSITDIEDPTEWYMYFTARNDDGLASETLAFGDNQIVVQSWPGDTYWSDEVGDALSEGVPMLQDLVDLEWRPQGDLTVLESIEPNLLGYGGWYLDIGDLIEIGEWVDPHLVLHEIGHTWFNEDLFEERWITEGLADEFASAVVAELGETSLYERQTPRSEGPFTFALNDWRVPKTFTREAEMREEYGYRASWWLMHEIVEEIGIDAMRDVIGAADADQIAYAGAGTLETVDPSDDWRRLLDLLQEIGGSQEAPDLFLEWVLADDAALDRRSDARASYAGLVDTADGWAIPLWVRRPMADWEFDDAAVAIDEALHVLAVRNEIRLTAGELQATPPESLRWAFETADASLADALVLAEAHRYTAREVQWAQHVTLDDRNPFQVVGLIGEHPEQELADAVAAFEIDDLDAANSIAGLLSSRIADAQSVGVSRLVKAVLAVLVLGAMIAALVVWIRRKRRPADTTELEPLEEIAVP